MAVSQTIAYRLDPASPDIRLTVIVGDAQKGATMVYLGGDPVDQWDDGEHTVSLGSAADLTGRKVICNTVVTDVNPQTDRTSVTWKLTGGLQAFAKTCTETLDQPGDTVLYSAVVFLI